MKVTTADLNYEAIAESKPQASYFLNQSFILGEKFIALVGLVVLCPLLAGLTIALKLQGLGSVFYGQTRVGLGGKLFTIYKFRTMYVNAESTGPFICTTYKDERITPFGRFLRKSKLDELPQLINVLKGEMSLIGPRPERPHFHKQHLKNIPGWSKRVEVKPGLTGLAQISAVISHDPEQKIVADLAYNQRRSLRSDIALIVMTAIPQARPEKFFGISLR